jgi:hypothetical protein
MNELQEKFEFNLQKKNQSQRNLVKKQTIIVPAADAALAVAYSPA